MGGRSRGGWVWPGRRQGAGALGLELSDDRVGGSKAWIAETAETVEGLGPKAPAPRRWPEKVHGLRPRRFSVDGHVGDGVERRGLGWDRVDVPGRTG